MGVTGVLILDRNDTLRRRLVRSLEASNTICVGASSLDEALHVVSDGPNVIALGVLKLTDSLDALRLLRARGTAAPILVYAFDVVTQDEVVTAIDAGADDAVGAAADRIEEINARIRALKRRVSGCFAVASTQIGDVEIDARCQRIFVDGQSLSLSRDQFRIASYLATMGRVVTYREIDRVLGYDVVASQAAQRHRVSQAMRRLRLRLGRSSYRVVTVPNVGYQLRVIIP
jgi:DNA-binding response OmpR family regulator